LQKNKVPLVGLTESEEKRALLNSPPFIAARQIEAQALTDLRAEYRLVKEALAAEGIADVMLKSVGRPPSFPYRSDNLDVLYRPQDVTRVKEVLHALGYVELKNVEEPHKYLFRKFHAGRSVSAIHVHAHVGWMVSFLDEEALWRRCRACADDPLVTAPAPEDAFLTTLAHFFYEDKCVSLLDVLKYAHCLRHGVDWDEVYRIATWRGWRDGLNASLLLCAYQEFVIYEETLAPLEILQRANHELPAWARAALERRLGLCYNNNGFVVATSVAPSTSTTFATMPLRIPFVFSKAFFYTKLLRDPSRSTTRKIKDLAVHTANGTKLRLHIHSQPSMLVTFSGVDGCGKTTQAKALQSAFEACHLRASQVWTRGGSASWLGLFTRLGKRRAEAAHVAPVSAAIQVQMRQQRFRSLWVRWAWSWLTTLELLCEYTRRVTLPLLRGRVVICDRYCYDALADWAAYFGEPSVERRLAARVLRWLCPRPKIAYWLDVTPDVALARSQDGLPVEFLAAQSAFYRRLTALYALRRLDGQQPWEEISDGVVEQVLNAYFDEYHTLLNSLFLKNPGQWI